MTINKFPLLLWSLGSGVCLLCSLTMSVQAKEPVDNGLGVRVSHSVGYQHEGRHNYGHTSHYRDPWRWGFGWNSAWGPSIGLSRYNGYDNRYGSRYGSRYDNRWGIDEYRGNNDNFYPYRTVNVAPIQSYQVVEPVVISAPQRTTTQIQYASGLSRLPENAKVIQRAAGTVYEWQGVEYYFDWNTQTYEVAKVDNLNSG
ncbi:hypothetical protein H5202_21910 [Shewanella sp. SG41-4]|uniref:hypothetical protein n=1 Tax=Shewanella sp. SG41-4 TaxID=2760976 RepID=UPI00183C62BB|nr:hypothetical protein [Shewanella sp. SG41-4]MBB1441236.1 hypothetical protein [Shewanella sp. SG41-4]